MSVTLGVMAATAIGAFVAGAAGGAWAWSRCRPWVEAWRHRPRVARAERRQRRLRARAAAAIEAAYAGEATEARWWARRALRLDPKHPLALAAMGQACKGRHEWKEAAAYLERALEGMQRTGRAGLPDHFIAETISELAGAHARAARDALEADERDQHVGKALAWLRAALEEEPELAENIHQDPAFSGIRQEVDLLLMGNMGFEFER